MTKSLQDMTNEELWVLFPIILSEHQPIWKENYRKEKNLIEKAIGIKNIVRISHYGSTSVKGLIAKPTIDILLEIQDDTNLNTLTTALENICYIGNIQAQAPAPHLMFMKGYTPLGFEGQAFHLHVRYQGDWDELYFRDYLQTHPEVAEEYGKLKLQLKEMYEHDRDAYTNAKSDFIKHFTRLARLGFFSQD